MTTRELLHTRSIELKGWRRDDGLYELDAWLTDLKTADMPLLGGPPRKAGEPLHGMGIRMRFDADLKIHAVEAIMQATPYAGCHGAAPNFARLAGLTIQPGFLREAQRRLGGIEGCTHLRELLQQLATTAYQTLAGERMRQRLPGPEPDPIERPKLIDSCTGYRSDGEAVLLRWPRFHTPPR